VTALTWSPRPRPDGMTVDVMNARCRCHRKLYVDLANVPGRPNYREDLDCWRCRGCDEPEPDCWCPSAAVSA
jgi:hypothetical protein